MNSKQVVTKQQLTCTGTLITWQSRSEQYKGKRTRDYKKKGSFLGLSERKMENRPRDAAKSSLMIWRRDQLKEGAHEHFSNHALYFEQLLLLQYLCCFTQCWQNYLGEWRTVPLPNSRLERWQFSALGPCSTHVERDLGQWGGKRWMYRTSEELQRQMAAKLGRQLLKPRVESFSGCSY